MKNQATEARRWRRANHDARRGSTCPCLADRRADDKSFRFQTMVRRTGKAEARPSTAPTDLASYPERAAALSGQGHESRPGLGLSLMSIHETSRLAPRDSCFAQRCSEITLLWRVDREG